MTPHEALRQATRAAHDRLDRSFADYNLGGESDYRRFLERHASAFLPAEQALSDAGAAELIADWKRRRRSTALLADLADLGMTPPPPREPPAYDDAAAVLGGAYVLEGSRLGGVLLRRSVGPGLPRRFLDSVTAAGQWRQFVALLNRSFYDPAALDRGIESALHTFALFE